MPCKGADEPESSNLLDCLLESAEEECCIDASSSSGDSDDVDLDPDVTEGDGVSSAHLQLARQGHQPSDEAKQGCCAAQRICYLFIVCRLPFCKFLLEV